MILDGFGIAKTEGNAIAAAKKPNLDKLFSENPITKIGASGMDVGLPDGQMGNSEVGHTNIGAGRIVYQELTRITKAVQDGTFFENEALVHAMSEAKANDKALHLIGLLSDGGVHSHNTHLYGLLEMAKKMGLTKVYVHALLDGRDVPPSSGKDFVAQLMEKMDEIFSNGKFDAVFHLAAILSHDRAHKKDLWSTNVDGTSNITSLCEKYDVKKQLDGIIDSFCEEKAKKSLEEQWINMNL